MGPFLIYCSAADMRVLQFSDMARMLTVYQLWLDDLYPRAKFADGLAMIEKLGHKKRMQIMRREWIDEGKPRPSMEDLQDVPSNEDAPASAADLENLLDDPESAPYFRESPIAQSHDRSDTAGEVEKIPANDGAGARAEPDEDELDALLAEDAEEPSRQGPNDTSYRSLFGNGSRQSGPSAEDAFEDEMEAMAELGDMW